MPETRTTEMSSNKSADGSLRAPINRVAGPPTEETRKLNSVYPKESGLTRLMPTTPSKLTLKSRVGMPPLLANQASTS